MITTFASTWSVTAWLKLRFVSRRVSYTRGWSLRVRSRRWTTILSTPACLRRRATSGSWPSRADTACERSNAISLAARRVSRIEHHRTSNMAEAELTASGGGDDRETERPQFGTRNLPHDGNVFQHNAWYVIVARVHVARDTRLTRHSTERACPT